MQPYLFPYIGYFQLIAAVDHFVIYDRAQYMKGGWINRNKILNKGSGEAQLFSFGVENSAVEISIHDKQWGKKFELERKKFLRGLEQNYSKSPHFKTAFPIIEKCLQFESTSVGELCGESLITISSYLGLPARFSWSGDYNYNEADPAQVKVLAILDQLKADHYINSIGGMDLYSKDDFAAKGIQLNFLKAGEISYDQFNNDFQPFLSIVDVMMFNSAEEIRDLLQNYELV